MNFDKKVDRKGTYCTQWDYIEDRFGKGNGSLVPFTISDEIHMDVTRKEFTSVLNIDSSISMVVSSPSKTFNIPTLGGSYAIIPQ